MMRPEIPSPEGADVGYRRGLAVGEADDDERLGADGVGGRRVAAGGLGGPPGTLERFDLGLVGLGDREGVAGVGGEG